MKLIVGLGNPGQKYDGTRHNIGFDVITFLANRFEVGRPKAKFNAEIAETVIKNEKTMLMCPLTFMNLSGQSVRAAFDFYKMELTDVIVICDDLALPIAKLRIKPRGSAGGQKGLNDVIKRLGSAEVARLRVGVGQPPENWDAADYVLGRFTEEEKPLMETAIQRAADAVELWVAEGTQFAMNHFNADPQKDSKKREPKKLKSTESTNVTMVESETDEQNNNH